MGATCTGLMELKIGRQRQEDDVICLHLFFKIGRVGNKGCTAVEGLFLWVQFPGVTRYANSLDLTHKCYFWLSDCWPISVHVSEIRCVQWEHFITHFRGSDP
jgi:hypothetical protein